jgi:cytochrome c
MQARQHLNAGDNDLYVVPTKAHLLAGLAIGLMLAPMHAARAEGDAVNGAKIFEQCGGCHSTEKGENIFGPSLYGVIGRPAGSIADFKYSLAMQEAVGKGLVWTPENIVNYLKDPRKFLDAFVGDAVPNKMTFSLADQKSREDVAAYLQLLAGN